MDVKVDRDSYNRVTEMVEKGGKGEYQLYPITKVGISDGTMGFHIALASELKKSKEVIERFTKINPRLKAGLNMLLEELEREDTMEENIYVRTVFFEAFCLLQQAWAADEIQKNLQRRRD
ncbi:MAG: hypothetical protein ACLUD1_07520 [Clostridia bacterium]